MKAKITKLSLLLCAALAASTAATIAGPGPQDVYRPLHSKQELSALKPGTRIAHECPHCGTITVSKAQKDMSHAEGFTCPTCKMEFTYRDSGSGKGGKQALIDCVDAKSGKKMSARVCAMH
jgi:predicted RNA-binding Zn-ribbon protein involved in translation (DUF1610 family)